MTSPPSLALMDVVGPALGGVIFVLGMSLVPDRRRLSFNAVFVAGTAGLYMSGGGFGAWELVYPLVAMPILLRAMASYRFIGLAWLMHAAWDLPHHVLGGPIWPFMPTSSFGCFVFDAVIGLWFLAGGPALVPKSWTGSTSERATSTLQA